MRGIPFGFLSWDCLTGMDEVGSTERTILERRSILWSSSSILVDGWGRGLVSLDLDGKELRCAQADAPGLTCGTGWGVPSL